MAPQRHVHKHTDTTTNTQNDQSHNLLQCSLRSHLAEIKINLAIMLKTILPSLPHTVITCNVYVPLPYRWEDCCCFDHQRIYRSRSYCLRSPFVSSPFDAITHSFRLFRVTSAWRHAAPRPMSAPIDRRTRTRDRCLQNGGRIWRAWNTKSDCHNRRTNKTLFQPINRPNYLDKNRRKCQPSANILCGRLPS